MAIRSVRALVLFVILGCLGAADRLHAATVTPEVAIAAVQAAPAALNLLGSVCKLPLTAAQVLYLPVGALELALAPLPGPTIAGGLTNIGKGLVGILKLVVNIIELPVAAINSISSAVNCGAGKP